MPPVYHGVAVLYYSDMEDTAHADIPLPPPVSPLRKWGWILIVLAAVLALIIASAWYCSTVVSRPQAPCVAQPASMDPQGAVSGTTCPDGATSRYRCENVTQWFRDFFGRKGG